MSSKSTTVKEDTNNNNNNNNNNSDTLEFMYVILNIKYCKKLEDTYHEYKLNRIRYYIQLNNELMHTTLSHIIRW